MDQEHEESWRMRIYNEPPTAQAKLVLPVVNSVKLQFNCIHYNLHITTGLLILCDGVISHNWPQIASDGTIHEKSHNSQKNPKNS